MNKREISKPHNQIFKSVEEKKLQTADRILSDEIERISYNKEYDKARKYLFPILKRYLKNASWKNLHDKSYSKYSPRQSNQSFSCIYSVYDAKFQIIEAAESFLTVQQKELSVENISNLLQNEHIPEDMIKNKKKYRKKRDEIKSYLKQQQYTPLDIIKLIENNWELLYPYHSTYMAIDYCILDSNCHNLYENLFDDLCNCQIDKIDI